MVMLVVGFLGREDCLFERGTMFGGGLLTYFDMRHGLVRCSLWL